VGTTITWPSAPGALAETGSGGMVTGCGGAKGCIAYIGISYVAKATAAGLASAALANKAGKFVQDTPASVGAALASFPAAPASGAEPLINTSAATGYPIINYEYAIVKKTQPSAAEASAVKAFLSWILTTGDSAKNLSTVGFVALPSATLSKAQSLVSSIGS
jgi:phosphate transport system substrate-binding protein